MESDNSLAIMRERKKLQLIMLVQYLSTEINDHRDQPLPLPLGHRIHQTVMVRWSRPSVIGKEERLLSLVIIRFMTTKTLQYLQQRWMGSAWPCIHEREERERLVSMLIMRRMMRKIQTYLVSLRQRRGIVSMPSSKSVLLLTRKQ